MTRNNPVDVDRALGSQPIPPRSALEASRRRLHSWYQSNSEEVHWAEIDSPLGRLFLAANRSGLIRLSFTDRAEQSIPNLDPRARLVKDGQEIQAYQQQLQEYFDGRRKEFSLPTDISNQTDFQRSVLRAIEGIPAGQVRSYGRVAEDVGRPGAARAVGQALGNNPIPIVLPCHRVVASDGSLGGYTGGLERKRQLLALEGALPLD